MLAGQDGDAVGRHRAALRGLRLSLSSARSRVDPRFQVITSAGAGSAAIAITTDLVQDDVERAVEGVLTPTPYAIEPCRAAR